MKKKTFYCQQNVNNNRKKYFYNQKENNKTCQQNKINALEKKNKNKNKKQKPLKTTTVKAFWTFKLPWRTWPIIRVQHLEKKMKKNNLNDPLIILKKLLKSKTDLMAHHTFDQQPYQTMFKSRSALVTALSIQRFRGRQLLPVMAYTGRLFPKGVPF